MDLYKTVTDEIIKHLENGVVPWKQPFELGTCPLNYITEKPYRGINVFLLNIPRFQSPYWLTFAQVNALGGTVKRGEKSSLVIFWKVLNVKDESSSEDEVKIPYLRYYRVFNLRQVDGLKDKSHPGSKILSPIDECEKVVSNYKGKPNIDYQASRASYNARMDLIYIPPLNTFISSEEYYSTLFHEMIHSTGHQSRLNRSGIVIKNKFGSVEYSKEELVAEMGASFLCAHTGISPSTLSNSSSYISGWLEALRNDKKLLFIASSQAQKACDYILNSEPAVLTGSHNRGTI